MKAHYLKKDLPKLIKRERNEQYYFEKYVKHWIGQAKYKRIKYARNSIFIPEYSEVVEGKAIKLQEPRATSARKNINIKPISRGLPKLLHKFKEQPKKSNFHMEKEEMLKTDYSEGNSVSTLERLMAMDDPEILNSTLPEKEKHTFRR